jgi:deoxyribodipyrimidine photo-lyase
MYKRAKALNEIQKTDGDCVIYIMSRDQRVEDNHAMLFAQSLGAKHSKPLIVVFNLYPNVKGRILNQYRFMIEGLQEVQVNLQNLNIEFILTSGKAVQNYQKIEQILNPMAVVFDFSPLRGPMKTQADFAANSKTPCFVVDTHNIIPVWETSSHEEFAARTIRPKIYGKLAEFLKSPPQLEKQQHFPIIQTDLDDNTFLNPDRATWQKILEQVKAPELKNYKPIVKSGSSEALKTLQDFLEKRLEDYGELRNIPSENFQSNLSQYFHFGQLSTLRAALEVIKCVERKTQQSITFSGFENRAGKPRSSNKLVASAEAFLEESIVRKELSDNYCYYNQNYDNFEGLKDWAKKTLTEHKNDKRDHIYSKDELEYGKTYDDAWNAAQIQMITVGKMHGYMRMYWAKKILEWSESPEDAIANAVYLNDKYMLDGYDPNGYAGIQWSMGGLHDRPWFERKVFGQIRYMNYEGLKRKFDVQKYIDQYIK